jgi:ubiquinone/menaquinone biosynthesis C-methylase UbiE
MNRPPEATTLAPDDPPSRRRFGQSYERMSSNRQFKRLMDPLRAEIVGQARGLILEIGAGNGLNFAYYSPETVEQVEAIEPSGTMLSYAQPRADEAPVPVHITQASVENLPFADQHFDSVVVTLVFCSVGDPQRGLSEVRRVLKPGGTLLMIEHVRAHNAVLVLLQNLYTPLSRRFNDNCHWNRETAKTVEQAGFRIEQRREMRWLGMPFVILRAVN